MNDDTSAKDVADLIIRNELERREQTSQAAIPDARPLGTGPVGLRPAPDFTGIPLSNPWAQNIIRQLVTNRGGGRT